MLVKSIKSQLMIASVLLVALLFAQIILSRNNQQTYENSLDMTQKAVTKVNLVRELERDVLDLQRTVLIYKETASNSIITRFESLVENTQTNLQELQNLTTLEGEENYYADYIKRMQGHLGDYQENFTNVVQGRQQREDVYEKGLLLHMDSLNRALDRLHDLKQSKQSLLDIDEVKLNLAEAENASFYYLLSPDFEHIKRFRTHINNAKSALPKISSEETSSWEDELSQLESEFIQLTQITRGYNFLVNVVMAGSANEFLYLARELNKLVTDNLVRTNQQVKETLHQTQLRGDIFSVFGIGLTVCIGLFLIYRIMLPINAITDLFRKLARGMEVKAIPGLQRKDEIGELAKAASVFHDKNQQTGSLLAEARVLNNKQEALNRELAKSKARAEQATASKSIFLANMSHEIRTPMNGIIGLLDLTMKTELNAQQRNYLNKIHQSTQILMSLINDILDFSKIEAGKLEIEQAEFSISEQVESLLANIHIRAREKNLSIRCFISPDLPEHLIGDALRINQVLLNLCSNAIKFTQKGGVTLLLHHSPTLDPQKIQLHAEVIDTGIGMNPTQLENIFQSFTQADGSTSRKFGGTGLGLSIVKQLTQLMKGDVTVTSQAGKGSCFKVSFELQKTQSRQQAFPAVIPSSMHLMYFGEGKDSLLTHDYLAHMDEDYQHYPQQALQKTLERLTPQHLVVLDVSRQEQFIRLDPLISELKSKLIPCLVVTDTHPENLVQKIHKLWQLETLSHPFTPMQLARALASLLGIELHISHARQLAMPAETSNKYEGHVLLVEDNNINQLVAGEMLNNLGLTYDIAEDGEQAVTKITNSPHYDLILMDIQMPVMDGYQATRQLREQGLKELIICGLSANAMQEDYQRAEEAGMNDYLTKPIDQSALETLVSRYLQPASDTGSTSLSRRH